MTEQDLVREQVADAGDQPLIHQRGLGRAAAPREKLLEPLAVQLERVGAGLLNLDPAAPDLEGLAH